MTVTEASLYANLHVETSPVAATAVWTDHIATLRDISVTRGGPETYIGVADVQPGSGTITLIDNTATIDPGYWVRLRYSSTVIWGGYVQDVATNYTFINNVTYAVKTLTVLDWAAWISQFSVESMPAANRLYDRAVDINTATGSTPLTLHVPGGIPPAYYSHADLVGTYTLGDVLNISATTSSSAYWRSLAAVPTGTGAGLTNLLDMHTVIGTLNVALTDGTHTGSPTNLTSYNDIEVATRTSTVSNNITVNNLFVLDGEAANTEYTTSDATSVATYGRRYASITTNSPEFQFLTYNATNLFPTPSFEDTLISYSSTNWDVTTEQPLLDSSGSWSAKGGNWALRTRNTTGAGTLSNVTDNIPYPVDAGTTYYAVAYGGHSNSSSVRGRIEIAWYNDAGAIISRTYGSYVTFTSARTWYKVTGTGAAPAGAVAARLSVAIDRSTGAVFASGTKLWGDAFYFGTTNVSDWFDGNFADTSSYLYFWWGSENDSKSSMVTNNLASRATSFLTSNKDAYYSPSRVRLNAQANITAALLLDTFNSVYIWFQSHRWTSVITGMTHNISVNPDGTTRWMIDLDIRPSAYTI